MAETRGRQSTGLGDFHLKLGRRYEPASDKASRVAGSCVERKKKPKHTTLSASRVTFQAPPYLSDNKAAGWNVPFTCNQLLKATQGGSEAGL